MVRSSSRPSVGYGSLDNPMQHPRPQPKFRFSYRNSLEEGASVSRPSKIIPGVEPSRWRNRSLWKLAVVCSLAIGVVAAVTWATGSSDALAGRYPRSGEGNFAETPVSDVTSTVMDPTSVRASASSPPSILAEPLEFTALNFYHVRDGKPGQDYPWLKNIKLIEPYRETTVSVTNARDGFEYRWKVRAESGNTGDVETAASGVTAVIVLQKLEGHVISLEEIDSAGRVTRRLDETVIVKYVRREIRTLTDSEREELLDAMFALWDVRVDDGNGKEIYGDDYADIWAINRLHFKAATVDSCDHFHDGLGFLVSHSLITNTFEHSLQAVNPKLTVPYWDFTIEESSSADPKYDPSLPYTRTPLLQPSWFGTYDPQDNIVKDGRWAFMKIPLTYPDNPGNLNTDIYGKLRSPWNTNNRPYISRGVGQMCQLNIDQSISWPTCTTHYDLVTSNDNFYGWTWDSMGDPHAPIHFWLGGVLDCHETYRNIADVAGTELANNLAYLANGYRKGLYCDRIWKCNGTVDVSVQPYEALESGVCGCLDYDLTQGGDYAFIMEKLEFFDFYAKDLDEDTKRQVVQAICSGVIAYGEHGQSSSPLDPTFWPTHPTMERLWQFSILTESVTDFHWPDKDITITLPDGESYTQVTSSYYGKCFGHRGSDVFPYGLLEDDGDDFDVWTGVRGAGKGNSLTNREVLAAFDPRENSMDYIYDTFKWEHCEEDGVFFDDAWGDTSGMVQSIAEHRFFETERPLARMYVGLKQEMSTILSGKSVDDL